jgi:hypothetical protein
LPDLTHATAAQHLEDLVPLAKDLAGSEGLKTLRHVEGFALALGAGGWIRCPQREIPFLYHSGTSAQPGNGPISTFRPVADCSLRTARRLVKGGKQWHGKDANPVLSPPF